MPSIKSCLVSLALAAFAFSPINAATNVDAGLAARHVEARDVQPSSSMTRRSVAAEALKKRAGRGRGRMTLMQQIHAAREARRPAHRGGAKSSASSSSGEGAYTPGSTFLSTPQALAAATIRCGTAIVCERKAPAPPTNGVSVCAAGRCSYRCETGYAPSGTDCVAASQTCGSETCQNLDNGYATCSNGACLYGCVQGYNLATSNGTPRCLDLSSDVQNCGAVGNSCPASYNGIGSAACGFGTCSITCPFGYTVRRAASLSNPYYCYNGQSSLVMN
ncbi:hypothetical protein JCM8202_004134 [Rhodotorula sphaerocarpa]